MTPPNLASRPFLNTRPVWLLVITSGALALALSATNLHLWLASNRSLAVQVERRDEMLAEQRQLEATLKSDSATLDRVPWKTLNRRVTNLNLVMRAHDFSWLDLLDDLARVLPREVRITRIAPTFDGDTVRLSLQGIARSRDDLLDLLDAMITDPEFDEPRPRTETFPEQAASATYEFTLDVLYTPQGDRP